MESSYEPIAVSLDPKYIFFIKIYFRYICQILESMYQKRCLRNNDEIKDNILDMKFPLHNITHDKIHKYVFILLLNDLC